MQHVHLDSVSDVPVVHIYKSKIHIVLYCCLIVDANGMGFTYIEICNVAFLKADWFIFETDVYQRNNIIHREHVHVIYYKRNFMATNTHNSQLTLESKLCDYLSGNVNAVDYVVYLLHLHSNLPTFYVISVVVNSIVVDTKAIIDHSVNLKSSVKHCNLASRDHDVVDYSVHITLHSHYEDFT